MAFLGTGQYMHHVHDHLHSMPDVPRLLFRSAHIYVLMISLLHMILGAYYVPAVGRVARTIQIVGSVGLTAALGFILLSFFRESLQGSIDRVLATLAIYLALAGCIMHVIAARVIADRRQGA